MPLAPDQVGLLSAAGSIPIPGPLPEFGLISIDLNGIAANDPSLEVAHYTSSTQKTTYLLALRDVTAIYLPDGLARTPGPIWIVGSDLQAGSGQIKSIAAAAKPLKGTVFAKEQTGVLMRIESAMTAGDIAGMPRTCV